MGPQLSDEPKAPEEPNKLIVIVPPPPPIAPVEPGFILWRNSSRTVLSILRLPLNLIRLIHGIQTC